MITPQMQKAPGAGCHRPEGENPNRIAINEHEEKFAMSIAPTPASDKAPALSPAIVTWTAAINRPVTLPDGVPDPISSTLPVPAWASVDSVSVCASNDDRVWFSEAASVPLLHHQGNERVQPDGSFVVDFASANVTIRHRHVERDPVIVLGMDTFEGHPLGRYAEVMRLRITEARELGAALTAAADVVDDGKPTDDSDPFDGRDTIDITCIERAARRLVDVAMDEASLEASAESVPGFETPQTRAHIRRVHEQRVGVYDELMRIAAALIGDKIMADPEDDEVVDLTALDQVDSTAGGNR